MLWSFNNFHSHSKTSFMAQIKEGPLGQVTGTVGNVTIGKWKNKTTVRNRRSSSNKPATQGQLEQQARLAVAGKFLRVLKNVLRVSFRNYASEMSGFNEAVRHLLKYGVEGNYPDYHINFSRVLVSRGELLNEPNPVATAETGQVTFTWNHVAQQGIADDDKAILVVYCEALNKCVYVLNGANRTVGTASIPAPRFKGYEVHTWLAFIAANGQDVADSVYTGKLTIT
jgi:hypothetical protein